MDRFPLLAPQAEGTLPSNLTTKDVMCGIIDGNLVICFFFPETLFRTHFFASFFRVFRGWLEENCHGFYILAQDLQFHH